MAKIGGKNGKKKKSKFLIREERQGLPCAKGHKAVNLKSCGKRGISRIAVLREKAGKRKAARSAIEEVPGRLQTD